MATWPKTDAQAKYHSVWRKGAGFLKQGRIQGLKRPEPSVKTPLGEQGALMKRLTEITDSGMEKQSGYIH